MNVTVALCEISVTRAEQRFVFLPGGLKKYLSTLCLCVPLSLSCCAMDAGVPQTSTLCCYSHLTGAVSNLYHHFLAYAAMLPH